jgi:hypothetical protein
MDKVKDAMSAGVGACGDAGPRDFGLWRGAHFERRVSVPFGQFAQVGQIALTAERFEQLGVE